MIRTSAILNLGGGGGGGGKATMIFRPLGLRAGVMVMWSKIFDHDHGQNFEMNRSNGQNFDHDHGQNPNFSWSRWLTSNFGRKLSKRIPI